MGRDRQGVVDTHRGQHHRPDGTQLRQQVRSVTSPQTVAQMASALAFIVERHRPDMFSATTQGLTCQTCTQTAGIPIAWPCPDREAIGRLLPDASNRLLPEPPATSLQPGGVPSSWPDG